MTTTKPRGFAAMDREQRREVSSLGGRRAHQSGNAQQFTSETGRAAALKMRARQREQAAAGAAAAEAFHTAKRGAVREAAVALVANAEAKRGAA